MLKADGDDLLSVSSDPFAGVAGECNVSGVAIESSNPSTHLPEELFDFGVFLEPRITR